MSSPTATPSAGSEATGEPEPTGTAPTDTGTPEPTATATTSEASGPQFISLQTSAAKITAGETVTITALVTDPDGLDDIVGGTLSNTDGTIAYGPFVAAGQPGTYSIDLTWDALQQAEPIEFVGMDLTRSFRAEFVDLAVHSATKTVDIALTCSTGSACDGVCIDTATDAAHCGACGVVCQDGCESSACTPTWGECINKDSGFTTCAEYCPTIGETCVEGGCGTDDTVVGYSITDECLINELGETYEEACDVPQSWSLGRQAVKCCCTDTP